VDEPKTAHALDAITGTSRLDPDTAALVREVLGRWREMDRRQAMALARNILVKLDGQLTAEQVHALDRNALRSRLEKLLEAA
jgi:mRNA-degrading endonuclease toxin of MazEF toxin-antitoxin module